MVEVTGDQITNALQVVISTISKCEKQQQKFLEGSSSHTLLRNRIKAMYISKELLSEDPERMKYSQDDLVQALKPVESIINKCEAGQKKYSAEAPLYKRFQKIIDAMTVAKALIIAEIDNRFK